MTKLFKLTALASAVFLLGACADETVLNPEQAREAAPESNAIQFGTYMGKAGMTRAAGDIGGLTGSMTTETLKGTSANSYKDGGFGVFAFYTGIKTYGGNGAADDYRGAGKYPDFMYNEHIYWDNTNSLWIYDNTKYWPNEFKKAGEATDSPVDDQNNDYGTDPAVVPGTMANGGNVTFFAYAPYVAVKAQSDDDAIDGATTYKTYEATPTTQATEGIVAISGNAWVGADAEVGKVGARKGDPYITYVLPAAATSKQVDLLWGTAGVNGVKANGANQTAGTLGTNEYGYETYNKTDDSKKDWAFNNTDKTYSADILKGYSVNDNLNKMNTTGKVEFVFKHALSKIGGSYIGSGDGDDENGTTPTNGLMVILDLDKDGQETGGSLQAYSDTPAGGKDANNKYNTKVTINELVIECSKQLKSTGDPKSKTFSYSSDTEDLTNKGKLNLATGRWGDYDKAATATSMKQEVVPSTYTGTGTYGQTNDDKTKDAILSQELAEPYGFTNTPRSNQNKAGFEDLPIGVTTVAKNVYESEANPFIFIPGTKPIMEFTITYTVRTYDAKLKNAYTEVKQKIKKRLYITTATELNKQYNILMHLGLTSVKFTATVSDWETTNVSGTTTDPGSGASPVTVFDEDIEHVYLPINVSGLLATVTNNSLGSNVNASAAADAITLSGVKYYTIDENGQNKEVTVSDYTNLEWKSADGTDLPDWLEQNSTDKNKLQAKSGSANTTFATRTATVRAQYKINDTGGKETYVYSEPYTVTQYGRIPTTASATLTVQSGKEGTGDASPNSVIIADGGTVTASAIKVTKFYETTSTGAKAATETVSDVTITTAEGWNVAKWVSASGNVLTVPSYSESSDRSTDVFLKVGSYQLKVGTIKQMKYVAP